MSQQEQEFSKAVDITNQHNQGYRTHRYQNRKVMEPTVKGTPVTGYEVFDWPEFKAFMDRLGFAEKDLPLPTTHIVIDIPLDRVVTIQQTYHAYEGREFP